MLFDVAFLLLTLDSFFFVSFRSFIYFFLKDSCLFLKTVFRFFKIYTFFWDDYIFVLFTYSFFVLMLDIFLCSGVCLSLYKVF